MCGRSATILLRAQYSEITKLERFVDSLTVLTNEDRRRVKITATELFDNIIAHGLGVRPPLVLLRVIINREIRIVIQYRTANFKELSDCLAQRLNGREEHRSAVRYDEVSARYRGLGLTMCKHLCKSVNARPGLIFNRITAQISLTK